MSLANCPACGHVLTNAERSEGWCENCGKRLPGAVGVQTTRTPAAREQAPLGPAIYQGGASAGALGWGTVRAGLAEVAVGQVLLSLVLVGLLLVFLSAELDARPADRGTLGEVLGVLTIGLSIVGGVLLLAGMCMGSAAPAGTQGKGAAVGVCVCVALQVLVLLITQATQAENERVARQNLRRAFEDRRLGGGPLAKPMPFSPAVLRGLRLARSAIAIVQGLLFVVFLRGVALTFGRRGLAAHLLFFLVLTLALGALAFLLQVAIETESALLRPRQARYVLYGSLGVGVVVLLWLLGLTLAVRRTITRALTR
jgi:hypothetical protein